MSNEHDNDTMRASYRELSDTEKGLMAAVKAEGQEFHNLLHTIGKTEPGGTLRSRELSLAATKIEEAVMWAVKYITG